MIDYKVKGFEDGCNIETHRKRINESNYTISNSQYSTENIPPYNFSIDILLELYSQLNNFAKYKKSKKTYNADPPSPSSIEKARDILKYIKKNSNYPLDKISIGVHAESGICIELKNKEYFLSIDIYSEVDEDGIDTTYVLGKRLDKQHRLEINSVKDLEEIRHLILKLSSE